MKRQDNFGTLRISEQINAAADRLLGHHVDLVAVFRRSRLGITCLVCGGRWAVMDTDRSSSSDNLKLRLTTDGDGYCEEGATNYFDSNGRITRRT